MTYSATILADSPVAYWRLGDASGPAADEVSTNVGTYTNGPTLSETGALTGDADTAVLFTYTSSQYVVVPHDASLNLGTGACSVELWMKPSAGGLGNAAWLVTKGTQTLSMYWSNTGIIRAALKNYSNMANSGATVVYDQNWHYCVVTHDGSQNYKVYVDGADVTTVDSAAYLPANTATDLYIAASETPDLYYGGTLDEVAIYASELSLAQVEAHYAAGLASGPAWTTPADAAAMTTTPELKFEIPDSASAQHFWLELDTVNTFDSGDLRTYRTDVSQTDWDYWNTSAWTAFPAGGVAITYIGEEVRLTVTSALSVDTWYRRVRAGT